MKTFNPLFIILSIFILNFSPANSAYLQLDDEQDDENKAAKLYESAYNNILDEDWEEAIKSMEIVIDKYSFTRWHDDARFWQCYAQEQLENSLEEVFECYSNFIEFFPDSKWTNDAEVNMIRVAQKLADSGNPEYNEIIKSMQENEDNEIAISAISALRNMGGDNGLKALLKIYTDSQPRKIKETIIYSLSEFDQPEARTKLMSIAKTDPDDEVREKAIFWLANNSDDEETIKFLEDIVQNDKSRGVREKAIFSISESSRKFGVPSLKKIAKNNPDSNLREKAIFWLGDGADSKDIIVFLEDIVANDISPEVREKAVFAISEAPENLGTPSLKNIARNNADPEIRQKAVFWLGDNADSKETIDFLADIIETDKSPEVRQKAVFAISEAKRDYAIPVLKKLAVENKNIEIRKKAIYWLGDNFSGKDILEFIKNVVQNDPNQEVKEYAVYALAEMDKSIALPALYEIAKHNSDSEIRAKAVYQIGNNSSSKQSVEILKNIAFEDSNSNVQEKAVYALYDIDRNKGISALIEIAKNHSQNRIRKKAIYWLGESKDPRARDTLLEIINESN